MSNLFSLGVRIVEAAAVVYATGVMFSRSALTVFFSLSYSLASRVGSAGRTDGQPATRSAYQCQVQSEKPRDDATWCSHEPPPPPLLLLMTRGFLAWNTTPFPSFRPSVQRGSQGVRQQQKGDLFFSHSSACHSLTHPSTDPIRAPLLLLAMMMMLIQIGARKNRSASCPTVERFGGTFSCWFGFVREGADAAACMP